MAFVCQEIKGLLTYLLTYLSRVFVTTSYYRPVCVMCVSYLLQISIKAVNQNCQVYIMSLSSLTVQS